MSYFSGFELLLLFCRVQKGQHTAKPNVCLVPVSSTQQTLTFTMCLTPAHGKGHAIHEPLLKRQRVHDVAVCYPEAHGKE